jgi:type I restriction enzyme, R subunit
VEDGATVPIDYESRLARVSLPEDEKLRIDEEIEELTEDEEVTAQKGCHVTPALPRITPSKPA